MWRMTVTDSLISTLANGSNRIQQAVAEFHAAMGSTVGDAPALRDLELRKKLIREEYDEVMEALEDEDLVAAAAEMCDLFYVLAGTFVAAGVDFAPIFEAIHAANMRKLGGPQRDDGKQQKPADWEPADIASLIGEQMAQARALLQG